MTTTYAEPRDTSECLDPDEVQIGTANGPGIYLGPPQTAPPEGTTGDWPAPWRCLGYLSDDGPTVSQTSDSEDLQPWQSAVPIRSVITSRGVTIQAVLWQLNAATLALYFDTDVPEENPDGSLHMTVRTDQAGHTYAIGIDSRDGGRVMRIVFPRANLTDVGDMPIQRGAVIPLDVTLSALETNGELCDIQLGPAVEGTRMAPSGNGTGTGNPAGTEPAPSATGGAGGAGSRSRARRAAGPEAGAEPELAPTP
jgi:hypothetical protein